MRLAPGGTPEHLATGVDGSLAADRRRRASSWCSDDRRRIRSVSHLRVAGHRDVAGDAARRWAPAPFELSPDGRWLVTTDTPTGAITFTDWRTGAQDVFRPPSRGARVPYQWRPGHVELWLPNGPGGPATTWIKTAGRRPRRGPRRRGSDDDRSSRADGAYWFSLKGVTYDEGIMVGLRRRSDGASVRGHGRGNAARRVLANAGRSDRGDGLDQHARAATTSTSSTRTRAEGR